MTALLKPSSDPLHGRSADATVLRAAHAYQGVTDWHTRRPEVPA